MPVLQEPPPQEPCHAQPPTTTYIYLGAALIICIGAVVRRNTRRQPLQSDTQSNVSTFGEKDKLLAVGDNSNVETEDLSQRSIPRIRSPRAPLPKDLAIPEIIQHSDVDQPTHPCLHPPHHLSKRATTQPLNLQTTLSHQPASYTDMPLDIPFTSSPISVPIHSDPSYPDPIFSPLFFPSSSQAHCHTHIQASGYLPAPTARERQTLPPRRRSYTCTTQGTEVSGEIVLGDGYRRHTRVFGGGACRACEESKSGVKRETV